MVRIEGVLNPKHGTKLKHEPSGQTIVTDPPVDNGGTGSSFSPTDLLASAYASCMITIMSMHAQRKGFSIEGTSFYVEKHMTQELPRKIATLKLGFQLPVSVPKDEREELLEKGKTCPVALSVSDSVKIEYSFEFIL